jgi:hypothetical protein
MAAIVNTSSYRKVNAEICNSQGLTVQDVITFAHALEADTHIDRNAKVRANDHKLWIHTEYEIPDD